MVVVRYVLDETRFYRCRDSLQVSKFPQLQYQKRRNLAEAMTFAPVLHADFSLFLLRFYCFLGEYFRIALKRPVVLVSLAGGIHSSVALIALYARLTPLILCTSGRRAKLSPGISEFHVEIYRPSAALRFILSSISQLHLY